MTFSYTFRKTSTWGLFLLLFRLLVGSVYMFAGVVKLVDPVGAGIKIHEYLEAFGLAFLQPMDMLMGGMAALAEFVLGAALMVGIFKQTVTKALLGITLFFTLLTFVLALTKPVTDCGCFGDALKLTNWQTFFKNLVLLAAVVFVFLFQSKMRLAYSRSKSILAFLVIVLAGASIPHYSYHHLPLFDFRPYAVGNHLPTLMEIPEGAPVDEFQTIFYYSKNGETKEFDESNYPWQDSTWVFEEMESRLIKKGYTPPIHDFRIEHPEKGDLVAEFLQSPSPQFLLFVPLIEDLSGTDKEKIARLSENIAESGENLVLVSASGINDINTLLSEHHIMATPANGDLTLIKTIIRSKAGLVIVQNGTVLSKFNRNDYPTKTYLQNPLAAELVVKSTLKSQLICLYLCFIFGGALLLILGYNPKHK